MERQKVTYNKAGVKALEKVREVIDSFGLPLIRARKFNGILNAIEMQIEDYEYADDVVEALDKALLALAGKYASDMRYAELERALAEFERRLGRKRRHSFMD